MHADDADALLVLASTFLEQDEELHDARREVYRALVEEAWKIAMRSRHYQTTQCLDTPSDSAWMMVYKYGSDVNFLNTTSLTRSAFNQLLQRFDVLGLNGAAAVKRLMLTLWRDQYVLSEGELSAFTVCVVINRILHLLIVIATID
ncbi:hypothetical protein PR002_g25341 [Phytophthora rubi]|uniref:Uncharacterized protein n=1 Tax=Phytophthora rubi TaxID=129364 RepID=A0A6A3I602_9STRA|nr:hypothetical protein PR002_g25341 [Phytophthora rubi]